MPSQDELNALYVNLDAFQDKYMEDVEGALTAVYERALDRLPNTYTGYEDPVDLAIILWAAGLGAVANSVPYSAIQGHHDAILEASGTNPSSPSTQRLRKASESHLRAKVSTLAASLSVAAGRTAFVPDTTNAITAIQDTLKKGLKGFKEEVDFTVSAFGRGYNRLQAASIQEPVFIYAGPADKKNRAFCGDIVRRGHAFTRAGIEALNDHPELHSYVPPQVATWCGGYGCRHMWLAVPLASAIENGLEVV